MAEEEFDELRRHLGAGASNGGAGPAGEENRMLALSVVSSEVGELRARLGQLSQRLEQAETSRQGDVEGLRQEVEALREETHRIGQSVVELSEAVASVDEDQDEAESPPQPWDWSSMDWREELRALGVLVEWIPELHRAWGPAISSGAAGADLPECWVQHADMRRQVSALYVAYQQAFLASQRRPHHETDWYRVLHERLHDIGQLAKKYKCNTDQHVVAQSPSLDKWQAYLRFQVLMRAVDAQKTGDSDALARIQDEFDISDDELYEAGRGRIEKAYARFSQLVQQLDDADSVCEAARLMLKHELIAADDLSQGSVVSALNTRLTTITRGADLPGGMTKTARRAMNLRSRLSKHYGPMLLRYSAVHKVIEQMVRQKRARQTGDQALERQLSTSINQQIAEHSITDEEISLVWHQERTE